MKGGRGSTRDEDLLMSEGAPSRFLSVFMARDEVGEQKYCVESGTYSFQAGGIVKSSHYRSGVWPSYLNYENLKIATW